MEISKEHYKSKIFPNFEFFKVLDIDIEFQLMYGSGLEDTASATQSVSNFAMLLF